MKDVPPDFFAALQPAGLADFFTACTPAHRREYLQWIAAAKRPATRAARIAQAIAMLIAKRAEEERRAKRKTPPASRRGESKN